MRNPREAGLLAIAGILAFVTDSEVLLNKAMLQARVHPEFQGTAFTEDDGPQARLDCALMNAELFPGVVAKSAKGLADVRRTAMALHHRLPVLQGEYAAELEVANGSLTDRVAELEADLRLAHLAVTDERKLAADERDRADHERDRADDWARQYVELVALSEHRRLDERRTAPTRLRVSGDSVTTSKLVGGGSSGPPNLARR